MSTPTKIKALVMSFLGNTKELVLLNLLHIFNDGSKVSLYILLPFLAKELHINLAQVGFLGTILNICLILFAIPAGYLSAKIGGVKILLIGLLFYAAGFITTGFAFSYGMLLCTFFFAGMGYGIFHPIGMLLITKWSSKETRGREMGNFTALGDIGTIVLPAVSAFIVVIMGWRGTTIFFGIVFLAIFFIFSLFMKSEIVKKEKRIQEHIALLSFFKHQQFLLATCTGALDNFASSPLIIFLPFLLLKKGMSPSLIGIFAGVYFIGSFAGKAVLGRSMDRFGNVKVFVISEICMAIFIFVLTFTNAFPLVFIAALIVGCFTKGTAPVTATMISDVVDHSGNAEKVFGINGFVSGIATTLAPVILGIISDTRGITVAFVIMALFAICATIPAFFMKKVQVKALLMQEIEKVG